MPSPKPSRARGSRLSFIRMHHTPDGSFPNGIPNPLLPENQPVTGDAVVLRTRPQMGVAWDGDFDRCFLFDATGRFIPGEYIVGLLAAAFLAKEPGATIIHDPRVIWNTQDIVAAAGGRAVQARTGHAFLKQALRDTGAVYGGEMSAHHYFRDFMACDSGMIPWLLVAELIGRSGKSLAELVSDRMAAFPSSGEINFVCPDADAAIARVEAALAAPEPAAGRDGRPQPRLCRLAAEPAPVQHRTPAAPECRGAGAGGGHRRQGRAASGLDRDGLSYRPR